MSRYVVAAFFYFQVYAVFSIDLLSLNDSSFDHISLQDVVKKGLDVCKSQFLELPVTWDWRLNKGVSSVKDQMECGAGYAFSALANIESQIMLQQPSVGEVDLSEQFIIDCNNQNARCRGGSVVNTFADIIANMGGVLEESDYRPYVHQSGRCRWDGDRSKMHTVKGFQKVEGDVDEIKKYLVCHGPLSASINSKMMETYQRNSYAIDQPKKSECPPDAKNQDHAVLIVGYGLFESKNKKTKVPYWIIKNSWGVEWGNDGYYYLASGTNACGIENNLSIAIVPNN